MHTLDDLTGIAKANLENVHAFMIGYTSKEGAHRHDVVVHRHDETGKFVIVDPRRGGLSGRALSGDSAYEALLSFARDHAFGLAEDQEAMLKSLGAEILAEQKDQARLEYVFASL